MKFNFFVRQMLKPWAMHLISFKMVVQLLIKCFANHFTVVIFFYRLLYKINVRFH